ncbi:MAG: hypothetical protein ABIF85_04580 [Nanoarchaeota archaeon]|nr:hypothetical protein [Nanoarchaeota archaeon]MBU4301016.1 hypothetical protein [Nanoarchaeota archaeon]MBU4452467.1 hypothetical protein [Nanoarchaeota archaeon]MCG2723997.1 hypothetical protein [archaeon]
MDLLEYLGVRRTPEKNYETLGIIADCGTKTRSDIRILLSNKERYIS